MPSTKMSEGNTLYKPTEKSKDCFENMISFEYKSKFVELDGIIDGVEYYKIYNCSWAWWALLVRMRGQKIQEYVTIIK